MEHDNSGKSFLLKFILHTARYKEATTAERLIYTMEGRNNQNKRRIIPTRTKFEITVQDACISSLFFTYVPTPNTDVQTPNIKLTHPKANNHFTSLTKFDGIVNILSR